jgi:hypothetical protein
MALSKKAVFRIASYKLHFVEAGSAIFGTPCAFIVPTASIAAMQVSFTVQVKGSQRLAQPAFLHKMQRLWVCIESWFQEELQTFASAAPFIQTDLPVNRNCYKYQC